MSQLWPIKDEDNTAFIERHIGKAIAAMVTGDRTIAELAAYMKITEDQAQQMIQYLLNKRRAMQIIRDGPPAYALVHHGRITIDDVTNS
jgi:hypothetical protein